MCTVCTLWQLGKLTAKEADKALNETLETADPNDIDYNHVWEVLDMIEEQEKLVKKDKV